MPVMIPGSAIGSTSTNEISSRPKKRKRWTPKDASVPSASAMKVASAAALSDSQSACCMSGLWIAVENHFVVRPGIGQLCTLDSLNAYRQMSAIGRYRNASTSATQTPSAIRAPRLSIRRSLPLERLEGAESARDQEVCAHHGERHGGVGGGERQVRRL